jgi:hypothetical protein
MNLPTANQTKKWPSGTFLHELIQWADYEPGGLGENVRGIDLEDARMQVQNPDALEEKADAIGVPISESTAMLQASKPIVNLGGALFHQSNPAGLLRNECATEQLQLIWRQMVQKLDAWADTRQQPPQLPVDAIRQALAEGADPNALTAEDLESYGRHLACRWEIESIGLTQSLDMCTALVAAGWLYPVDFIEAVIDAAMHNGSLRPVAELAAISHGRWLAEERSARALADAPTKPIRNRARA